MMAKMMTTIDSLRADNERLLQRVSQLQAQCDRVQNLEDVAKAAMGVGSETLGAMAETLEGLASAVQRAEWTAEQPALGSDAQDETGDRENGEGDSEELEGRTFHCRCGRTVTLSEEFIRTAPRSRPGATDIILACECGNEGAIDVGPPYKPATADAAEGVID